MGSASSPAGPTPLVTCDVVVVGGGVMGAATALALAQGREHAPGTDGRTARSPQDVVLLETHAPGHDAGSSHGDGRIVRFTYAEAIYLEMASLAFPAWRRIEQDSGARLLEVTGSWECGEQDNPEIDALIAGLRGARIHHQVFGAEESRRNFPQFELPPGSRVVYQEDGAIVRADRAWRTLWRLAESAGCRAWPEARVESIEPDASGVTVRVAGNGRNERAKTIRADACIVTAGAWTGRLLADTGLHLPLHATREVVAYFEPAPNARIAGVDHRVGSMPTFIDYHGGEIFYGLPSIRVPGVKVGWHHQGLALDDEVFADPAARVAHERRNLDRMVSYVGDRLPYLDLHPSKVLGCLYTNTPDYHFVLDRHPAHERVVVGAGFSGHGFKFAPVVGDVLADLAVGAEPALDLQTFAIGRFASDDAMATARRTIA